MPWQQYFYDVFGEVDPKTGIRIYRECTISAMRQVGKTTGVRVAKAHRALDTVTPQLIQFAAQDGVEAKKKWLEHAKLIKKSPLADRLLSLTEPVTSNGKEALNWANGSVEFPISSKPDSGHGDTLHLGVVTEAWSLQDDRYENTMLPAMNTVPDAQLLIESTEGTAQSLYWNARVDEQRARYEADPHAPGRTMFLDWSFAPDDDPGDPATWVRRIPSLGHTLRLEEIQYAYDRATTPMKMRQFLRGFGNIRDLGAAEGSIFDADAWEAGANSASSIVGDTTFVLEVSLDRSWSTIGIAGKGIAGGTHVGIAQRQRGTHWCVDYLARKMEQLGSTVVYVAAGSPAAAMASDLERVGLTVIVLSRAEIAAACAGLYDDILNGEIQYTPGQDALEAAIAGAVWTGGDVRVFSRGSSTVDVSPLYAIALARHGSILIAQEVTYDPIATIF